MLLFDGIDIGVGEAGHGLGFDALLAHLWWGRRRDRISESVGWCLAPVPSGGVHGDLHRFVALDDVLLEGEGSLTTHGARDGTGQQHQEYRSGPHGILQE